MGLVVGILSRIPRDAGACPSQHTDSHGLGRAGGADPRENTDPTAGSQHCPLRAVLFWARECPFGSQFAHLGNGENESPLAEV